MTQPVDRYPSKPLTQIKEKPIGIAKFKEPIFKLGTFQNDYIEVEVEVYPIVVSDPANEEKRLVAVRFGQMNVVRFINQDLLYDIKTN